MKTIELAVRDRSVRINSTSGNLVRTSVGVDQVHVLFDSPEWLEFPVTATFRQDDDIRTIPIIVSEVDGSAEWAAESFVTVPYEVIDMTGPIRVTFQGTDGSGRHIITAVGSPLNVIESGDADIGPDPDSMPSTDEWQHVYADAIVAINRASSLVENLQDRVDDIVSSAVESIERMKARILEPASQESLGSVKVGDGLDIEDDGTLMVTSVTGITDDQTMQLRNLAGLAYYCFDTEFDISGDIKDNASVKPSALPSATISSKGAVIPDGTSVTIDDDGVLHFRGTIEHEWDGATLRITTNSGTSAANLEGPAGEISEVTATVAESTGTPSVEVALGGTPSQRTIGFAFSGLKGETGERGPAGYVLTKDDVEIISDEILSRYAIIDGTRF